MTTVEGAAVQLQAVQMSGELPKEAATKLATIVAAAADESNDGQVEPATRTLEENARELVYIEAKLEAFGALVEAASQRKNAVSETLKEQFAESGVQSVKMHGRLVYLYRRPTVKIEDAGNVIDILDDNSAAEVAPRSITTAKLSALVKEDEAKWKPLLESCVKFDDVYSIRTKAAK